MEAAHRGTCFAMATRHVTPRKTASTQRAANIYPGRLALTGYHTFGLLFTTNIACIAKVSETMLYDMAAKLCHNYNTYNLLNQN